MKTILISALMAICFALCGATFAQGTKNAAPLSAPLERPHWDLAALTRTPKTSPAPKELNRTGLRAIFYEGLPWKGKPTKVFAWLGVPEHQPGEKVPGVVLLHGGGGTASDGGVKLWMSRGYAAISMDTTGSYPGRNMEQHAEGGPRGNGENFAQIDQPLPDQWMYQAVGAVALANSLLRSLAEVDPGRIGLTGLSWGGVLAGTVAGVDNRFRWVAPVYGCGYMNESEYFAPVLKAYNGEKWMALWDPSQYLANAKMPILWINGTNDEYFQMGMWGKSARLAPGPRTQSLKIRMNHSGEDGERPEEIYAFAESLVRGGEPLPRLDVPKRDRANVTDAVIARAPLAKAELAFTKDTGKWSKRRWETQPATVTTQGKKQLVSGVLPAGTTTWFVRVEDAKGRSVTTDFEELTDPIPAPAPLPQNTVYVSPQGRDANPGTQSKPVASLFRARDLARSQPRTSPIHVVLRGGTYSLRSPLELTAADSGTDIAPVVWRAAPGEKVVLSGGVAISGWKPTIVNGRTAWTVILPEVKSGAWFFRSLYGSGRDANRRPRARLPNTRFFEVAEVLKRDKDEGDWLNGRDRFFYKAGDLSAVADSPDKTSAEIVLLTQWCESHLPIAAIDPAKRFVVSSKFTIQNFGAKNRFWVENTRAALDAPGEWTLNKDTGELLYLPRPGETPKNTTLIAPRATTLVTLKETANVTFRNLTFSHNEWWFPANYYAAGYAAHANKTWAIQQGASDVAGAIQGDRTHNFVMEDCEISHSGSFGIVLGGAARNNRLVRTNLFDLGAGGIRIGPTSVNKNKIAEEVALGNVISDCRITDAGHLFTGAVGIWLGHTQKSEVVHNEISEMYYTGISCGWVWGFGDNQPSRDNVIAWNRIHNLGKNVLGDGAGIYLLGGQPGTIIEGNVVHDMNGNFASRGIYLDDGSSEMTVRNNLSFRNKTANFFQWRSKGNRVENNVFAFGEESQVELGGAVFNDGALAMNFERNIVVVAPGPFLNAFQPSNVKDIYKFSKNLVWRPDGKSAIPENAKAVGWDASSLSVDPQFLDLNTFDFRLKPDSPAIMQLGFVPVDWSKAGPRARR